MAQSWAGEDDLEVVAAERIEAGESAPYSGILGKANELATATKLSPKDQMAFWRFLISVDDDIVLLPFVDPETNPVCSCVEIKLYGAFVLNRSVDLHAIDATPARWRGDAGSSPLDGAGTAASSPRNDLVKNCRVHPTHWLVSTQVLGMKLLPLIVQHLE